MLKDVLVISELRSYLAAPREFSPRLIAFSLTAGIGELSSACLTMRSPALKYR